MVDYRVYLLVNENGYITMLRTDNHVNMYISKTSSSVLKRDKE